MARSFIRKSCDPTSPLLGKLGELETRLARTKAEIRCAQALRYQVFYEEMGARANMRSRFLRRDQDAFDRYCDHLLVVDKTVQNPGVVGTYRLLPDVVARRTGGFYSEAEFDIAPLMNAHSGRRFLEVGRSCILPDYRTRRTLEIMWHGLWAYALENHVDILFGCASFAGTDMEKLSKPLSWLARNAMLDERENCLPATTNSFSLHTLRKAENSRSALTEIPPLLKGYLRLGANVASHAVIDHQFGTTDVLVVLKVANINPRYLAHYGADASRFAA